MKISKELLNKYNVPVPRYTSYPPANHFTGDFSESDYISLIDQSNHGEPGHVAFYIHIPFCRKICFYCGCNSCNIQNSQIVGNYINALKKEIGIVVRLIHKNRKVSQIHYGGGTPNAIDVKFIEEINELLLKSFAFIDNPEIAVECNPAYIDYEYLEHLLRAGFNRLSFGIQDFNPDILKAVNREPSSLPIHEIIHFLRNINPQVSVNLDFIFGLPGQNVSSFMESIAKAIEIRPDRLVTFSYAHVPWIKKHQKVLESIGLPSPDEKMGMFLTARDLLLQSDYIPIGLDHYVLPNDELSKALERHQLHRNFQGYCTKRTTGQVYAFGASAISQLNNGYSQNMKDVKHYIQYVSQEKLPVEKGYMLTDNQIIIKDCINEIMCNKRLKPGNLAGKYGITLKETKQITGFNEDKIAGFVEDGLVKFDRNEISVTLKGDIFIRNIAAIFDPGYKQMDNKYSKTV